MFKKWFKIIQDFFFFWSGLGAFVLGIHRGDHLLWASAVLFMTFYSGFNRFFNPENHFLSESMYASYCRQTKRNQISLAVSSEKEETKTQEPISKELRMAISRILSDVNGEFALKACSQLVELFKSPWAGGIALLLLNVWVGHK